MNSAYLRWLWLVSGCTLGVTIPGPTHSASPFLDPNIPPGETITYRCEVGESSFNQVERVSLIREGERELYEISSRSPRLDRTIRLTRNTLAIISVHTVRKFSEVTLDSRLSVINENPEGEKDEVKLADFAVMPYVFRGFPFDTRKKLKIGFYGSERKKTFTFVAEHKGIEQLIINQSTLSCHKLEFGMEGWWGTFFPKINVWYTVDVPHYLVRYEGPEGPPGSPKRTLELIEYTITDEKTTP